MSAHAVKAIIEVRNLLNWAELIASVSLKLMMVVLRLLIMMFMLLEIIKDNK